jgi:DNA-binding CsgD family transcriptional regulator/PAS domain-containing protein
MPKPESSDIIERIYQAALEPQLWPELTNSIADLLHSGVGVLTGFDRRTLTTQHLAPRVAPEWLRLYRDRWVGRNPMMSAAARLPAGTISTDEQVISREQLERSDLFQEWLQPQGMEHAVAAQLRLDDSAGDMLVVWRDRDHGRFRDDERELLTELTPHLQRALRANSYLGRLSLQNAAYREALNQLSQAVLLVDSGCRVSFANAAAEKLFAKDGGLRHDANGLRVEDHTETQLLRDLVAACTNGTYDALVANELVRVSRGEGRAPLLVRGTPIRGDLDWAYRGGTLAMLFVLDPMPSQPDCGAYLQRVFGLTPAERAVALEILDGCGLKAAAERLGISIATARTHLSHIFAKTGTHRQAQLVRLLIQMAGAQRPRWPL